MPRKGTRALIRALVFLFASVTAAAAYVSSGGDDVLLRSVPGVTGSAELAGASDVVTESLGDPFATQLPMSGADDVIVSGYLSSGLPPGDPVIYTVYSTSVTVVYTLADAAGYIVDGSTDSDFNGDIYSSSTLSVSLSTLTVLSLTPNTTYYMRAGSLWNDDTTNYAFTTPASTLTLAAVPGVPGNPFTGSDCTALTVTWLDNGNPDYTEYFVQVSTDSNFNGTLYYPEGGAVWVVGVSTEIPGLTTGVTYYARVKARNTGGIETAYQPLGSGQPGVTWTGGSGNWYTAANWSSASVPAADACVTIDRSVIVTVSASSPSINFSSLVLGDTDGTYAATLRVSTTMAAPTGVMTVYNNATLESGTTQQHLISSITVTQGGKLTHTVNPAGDTMTYALNIRTVLDFDLQAGATITVAGLGYAGGTAGHNAGYGSGGGVLANYVGGGGGHGGNGGIGNGLWGSAAGGGAYDALTAPSNFGSGGAYSNNVSAVGGAGGGAVVLSAGGTLTVNGQIDASGGGVSVGWAGGGAGGAINLTAATLAGSGTLTAGGGGVSPYSPNGNGGGGGGGRIAVLTTSVDNSNLSLSVSAGASAGAYGLSGGAGTIAIKRPGMTNYHLLMLSTAVVAGALTPVTGASVTFDSMTFYNARPSFDAGSVVTANNLVTSSGTSTISLSTLTALAGLSIPAGNSTLTGSALDLPAGNLDLLPGATGVFNITTVTVQTGSLTMGAYSVGTFNGLLLALSNNFTVGQHAALGPNVSSITFGAGTGLTVQAGGTVMQSTTMMLNIVGNVTLQSGALWKHAANTTARSNIVNVRTTGDFDLQAGATISVVGLGYAGGTSGHIAGYGPGGGSSGGYTGGGGGHGGNGGLGNGLWGSAAGGPGYDNLMDPIELGSGGGYSSNTMAPGAPGGGAVIINAGGTLTLNGTIDVAGATANVNAGAGAGGAINLIAATLAGSGTLKADGGAVGAYYNNLNGGGGGGGRIAILSTSADSSNLSLSASAGFSPGQYGLSGGAGTIAIKRPGMINYHLLMVSTAVVAGALTPVPGASMTFDSMTFYNAQPTFDAGSVVTASSLFTSSGTSTVLFSTLTAPGLSVPAGNSILNGSFLNLTTNGAALAANSTTTINALAMDVQAGGLSVGAGAVLAPNLSTMAFTSGQGLTVQYGGTVSQSTTTRLSVQGGVTLQSGALWTHAANTDTAAPWVPNALVNIAVSGDFDLQAGATLSVAGKGYTGGVSGDGRGPGGGVMAFGAGGGGHGGRGGNANPTGGGSGLGGAAYDSQIDPGDLGSGGGYSSNSMTPGSPGGGLIVLRVDGTFTLAGSVNADGTGQTGTSGAGGGAGGSINISASVLQGSGGLQANGGIGGAYGANNSGGGGAGGRVAIVPTTCSSSLSVLASSGASGGGAAQAGGVGTWYPYPPSFTGAVQGISSITWTWGSVCNAAAYNVMTASNNVNMSGSLGVLTWDEINLSTNTQYGRQSRGVNTVTGFPTALSDSVTFYTLAAIPGVPADPFTGSGCSSLMVNWLSNGNPGYTEYFVEASTDSNFNGTLYYPEGGAVWFVGVSTEITGLTTGVTYYARVKARNGDQIETDYQPLGSHVVGVGGTQVWVGGGGDNNWYTANNWDPAGIPGACSAQVIDKNVTVTVSASSPSINFGSLVLGDTDGTYAATLRVSTTIAAPLALITVYKNATLESGTTQQHLVNSITVEQGGKLTHTANAAGNVQTARLYLNVAGDFDLQAGATITVSGLGYLGGTALGSGPGGGTGYANDSYGGSGGGHGGAGGAGSYAGGAAYDVFSDPADHGSGGGGNSYVVHFGGNGGGTVILNVGGAMALNGLITANGADGSTTYAAGGAGGTVNISAGTLAGSGAIGANGGKGYNTIYTGGGSGGIIALRVASGAVPPALIALSTASAGAGGGAAGFAGAAGPVYLQDASQTTSFSLKLGGGSVAAEAITPIPGAALAIDTFTISGGIVSFAAGSAVVFGTSVSVSGTNTMIFTTATFSPTVDFNGVDTIRASSVVFQSAVSFVGTDVIIGTATFNGAVTLPGADSLTVTSATFAGGLSLPDGTSNTITYGYIKLPVGALNIPANNTFVQNSTVPAVILGDVTMSQGAKWTHAANAAGNAQTARVNLSVAGDFDLQAGATIAANGLGYLGGTALGSGPGGGTGYGNDSYGGGGGGHGGAGGNGGVAGGAAYDLLSGPSDHGSGGGGNSYLGRYGGNGGGAVMLSVGGAMTLNGLVTVNGVDGSNTYAAGGAGGTVNISAGSVSGGGALYANGGAGYNTIYTGGGAGGRIAISPASCSSTFALAASSGTAPGAASQPGGMGTWYPYPPSFSGSAQGISSITWTWGALCSAGDYNVVRATNGVVISTPAALTWDEVGLSTNTAYGRQARGRNGVTLFPSQLSDSATFYTLAALPGVPAEPFTDVYTSSVTVTWLDNGNPSYTEYQVQASTAADFTGTLLGPEGGPDSWFTGVSTTVVSLSACPLYYFRVQARNGDLIPTGFVTLGSKQIGADGGSPIYRWTGASNSTWTVAGNWTPEGVCTPAGLAPGPSDTAIIDINAANQPVIWYSTSVYSIYIATSGVYGSTLTANYPLTVSSMVVVGAKGVVTHTVNTSAGTYRINISAGEILMNGMIYLSGKGYPAASGPGAGTSDAASSGFGGGGGGHGGKGGSTSRVAGGAVNDSLSAPIDLGSGGGNAYGVAGGSGGGAVSITAVNDMTINGSITANGTNGQNAGGFGSGGGGAGGAINLTAQNLLGSGTLQVGGGAGGSSYSSGGGAGGRVAITVSGANSSSLAITASAGAKGMSGANGGAGTTYTKDPGQTNFSLALRSSLAAGADTPVTGASVTIDTFTVMNARAVFDTGSYLLLTTSASISGTNSITVSTALFTPSVNFAGANTVTLATAVFSGGLSLPGGSVNTINYGWFSIPGSLTVPANNTFSQQSLSTVTINGDLTLNSGAVWTQAANPGGTKLYVVNLSVTGDFDLQTGAAITLDGKGYPAASGPGAGTSDAASSGFGGAGGGHGGKGGATSRVAGGAANDPLSAPLDLGSGGGNAWGVAGGAGGGAVNITAVNNMTINGSITANGTNGANAAGFGSGGGGAGGAINLTAQNLLGSGTLQVGGGAGGSSYSSGGGAGGRVAITVSGANSSSLAITASAGAKGASGANGGAGTTYTKDPGQTNFSLALRSSLAAGADTPVTGASVTIDTFTVMNARAVFDNPSYLVLTTSANISGTNTITLSTAVFTPSVNFAGASTVVFSSAVFSSGLSLPSDSTNTITYGWFSIPGSLTVPDNNTFSQRSLSALTINGDLTMNSGAVWTHTANPGGTKLYMVNLSVTGDLDLQAGAGITTNSNGYPAASGPGAGTSDAASSGYGGGGGGHGGKGGAGGRVAGGVANDSLSVPLDLGSGGGNAWGVAGGAGGGAVKVTAGNTMTLNGNITANGANGANAAGFGSGGGGGGGTINLAALNLQGSGTLQTGGGAGGSSYSSGGGGGGRIAITQNSCSASFGLSSLGGAKGSAGQPGADGTWYPYPPSFTGAVLGVSSITWDWGSLCTADQYNIMTASNNVILSTPTVLTWDEVSLATNTAYGRQVRGRNAATLFPSVLSDSVTFYTLAAVPGVPAEPFTGVFAASVTVTWLDNGNPAYTEYQVQASTAADFTGTLLGPEGGPNSWFTGVSTTVVSLAGCNTLYYFQVRARNGDLIPTDFVTLGSTETTGGTAASAYRWTGASNSTWTVAGNWEPQGCAAAGLAPGPADTAIIDINAANQPQIWYSTSVYSIYIATSGVYGSTLTANYPLTVSSMVVVGAKGVITHTANTSIAVYKVNINTGGDFDLQAGAMLSVTGKGYNGGFNADGMGPGGGLRANSGGGGGHGGMGGGSGAAYDNLTDPMDLGSGGAASLIYGGQGAPGGGAVIMNVAGTLTLNGLVVADGANGNFYYAGPEGAGAGGTVNLTASVLQGAGTLRANGGTGGPIYSSYYGAGGGGGRVAVTATSANASTLAIYAYAGAPGGGSAAAGGAGTIALKNPGMSDYHLLIVSPSVLSGANTPVTGASISFGSMTFCNALPVFDAGSIVTADGLVTSSATSTVIFSTLTAAGLSVPAGASVFNGSFLNLTANGAALGVNSVTTLNALALDVRSGGLSVGAGATLSPNLSTMAFASGQGLTVAASGTVSQSTTTQLNVLGYVTLQSGALLTHAANTDSAAPWVPNASINLSVSDDFDLQSGATISVSGLGYNGGFNAEGKGPGGGLRTNNGGGGGHGGMGGGSGAAYDSLTDPMDLGSGGGASLIYGGQGAPGGGAVVVKVGGTLTLNGLVAADGANGNLYYAGPEGAGAGGTVNLTAGVLQGAGTLRANGGTGGPNYSGYYGAGGGGGRVAVTATSANASTLVISAYAGATGGGSAAAGGAGTIALKNPGMSDYHLLIVSPSVLSGANTPVTGASLSFASVTVHGATLVFDADSVVSAGSLFTSSGTSTVVLSTLNVAGLSVPAGVSVYNGSIINVQSGDVVIGAGVTLNPNISSMTFAAGQGIIEQSGATILQSTAATLNVIGNVTLQSGALLTHAANTDSAAPWVSNAIVNLSVSGDFDLQSGSTISVAGLGYRGGFNLDGMGPGGGLRTNNGGGGGHGGMGGAGGSGAAYDSLTDPMDSGSGGGASLTYGGQGAPGGGAVVVKVGGTLTLDGLVDANGFNGNVYFPGPDGAGAGGTVNLTAGVLQGAGTLRANGGTGGPAYSGYYGAGGGGGRIALTQTTCSSSLSINGSGGPQGGGTATAGQPGTWYPYPPSFTGAVLGVSSITWDWGSLCTADQYNIMTASNNVILSTPTVLTWDEVNLTTNTAYGRQVRGRNAATLFPSVLSDSVTFYTLAAVPGVPAEPFTDVYTSSVTVTWLDNGNPSYTEYQVQASTAADFTGTLLGPEGGPNSWFTGVSTTVVSLAGCNTLYYFQVRARNGDLIPTDFITLGAKQIGADGGAPIYRWTGASNSTWTVAGNWTPEGACTPAGVAPGPADTAIIDINAANQPVIWYSTSVYSIYIATSGVYGSTLTVNYPLTVSSMVVVGAKGVVTHSVNTAAGTYKINISAGELQLLGMINVNAKGYPGGVNSDGAGTGHGHGGALGAAAGAGHAGYGGRDAGAAYAGGIPYDSFSNPVDHGSGGGGAGGGGTGGAGGGAVLLTVSSSITLNGLITANGGNATATGYGNGGGSGGSINILAGTISGSGSLASGGGAGSHVSFYGGGGSGGLIAVKVTSGQVPAGLVTLSGAGAGANSGSTSLSGAAGLVYYQDAGQANFNLKAGGGSVVAQSLTSVTGASVVIDTFSISNAMVSFQSNSYAVFTTSVSIAGTNTINLTTATFTPEVAFSGVNTVVFSSATFSSGISLPVGSVNTVTYGFLNLPAGDLTLPDNNTFIQSSTSPCTLNGSLTMNQGSMWTHTNNAAGNTQTSRINLNVTGDFTLQAGATVTVSGKGYPGGTNAAGYGTGKGYGGALGAGSGAGHGGYGGNPDNGSYPGGVSYDSVSNPVDGGSGGGSGGGGGLGGTGGGSVLMNIGGAVTLDGLIAANGTNASATGYGGGGGAGGSIDILAGAASGSGVVTANGGNGSFSSFYGGGGGGGRIALAQTSCSASYSLSGSGGAKGGGTAQNGYDGTWYPYPPSFGGSAQGTSYITWTWDSLCTADRYNVMTASNSVILSTPTVLTWDEVNLATNTAYGRRVRGRNASTLFPSVLSDSVTFYTLAAVPGVPAEPFTGVFAASVTVTWLDNGNPSYTEYQVQASTAADFTGTLLGPEGGPNSWFTGVSTTVVSLAGCNTLYYFQVRARNGDLIPTDFVTLGSTETTGGTAASAYRWTGASNSTWTVAGNWEPQGCAAAGLAPGPSDTAIIDINAANQPVIWYSTSVYSVYIATSGVYGSTLTANYPLTVSSMVVVGAKGVIAHSVSTAGTYKINIAAGEIQLDGMINVTGKGYQGATSSKGGGPGGGGGGGGSGGGGGGGHGGVGGKGAGGATYTGGAAYDSRSNPVDHGSAGGGHNFGAGGHGGGVVILSAVSTMTLNGSIYAHGTAGDSGGGGGAGGTVNISALSILGSGLVRASGSSGSNYTSYYGGGGAGGAIALRATSGEISSDLITLAGAYAGASGGGAAQSGGAGKVYYKDGGQTNESLKIDGGSVVAQSSSPVGGVSVTIDTFTIRNAWVPFDNGAYLLLTTSASITGTNTITVSTALFTPEISLSGANTVTLTTAVFSGGLSLPVGSVNTINYGWFSVPGNLTVPANNTFSQQSVAAVTINGDLTLNQGAKWLHAANAASGAQTARVNLNVTGDFSLQAGSTIAVDGLGYPGATSLKGYGPGGGGGGGGSGGGGGAGHGGVGGKGSMYSAGALNDSRANPVNHGSGGGGDNFGAGGTGGGTVLLGVGGAAALDGLISANGTSSSGHGGGAGGSINISALSISGAGTLRANGGAGAASGSYYGGGGAGGLISLRAASGQVPTDLIALSAASPGAGSGGTSLAAGAGSIYYQDGGQTNFNLKISGGSVVSQSSTPVTGASVTIDTFTIRNAWVPFDSGAYLLVTTSANASGTNTLTVSSAEFMSQVDFTGTNYVTLGTAAFSGGAVLSGNNTVVFTSAAFASLSIPGTPTNSVTYGWLGVAGNLTVPANNTFTQQSPSTSMISGDLTINKGALWTHASNTDTAAPWVPNAVLNLSVSGNFDLQTGSTITAYGKGYPGGTTGNGYGPGGGLGGGANAGGGGGGHGGAGGAGSQFGGGAANGSLSDPVDLGSGGGGTSGGAGGAGAGAIILTVGNTMTVNGLIAATGVATTNGGGAGGTINLTAANLLGSGELRANGAAGGTIATGGGGGGGGRIKVVVSGANSSNLTMTASAGAKTDTGSVNGGTGVIYTKDPGQSNFNLILNGSIVAGANTPITGASVTVDTFTIINSRPVFDNASYLLLTTSASISGTNVITMSTAVFIPEISLIGANTVTLGTAVFSGGLTLPAGSANTVYYRWFSVPGSLTLPANNIFSAQALSTVTINGDLTLNQGAWWTHAPNTDTAAPWAPNAALYLAVTGNFDLQAGSTITVDGKGYPGGTTGNGYGPGGGLGGGSNAGGGGGGHGGAGGAGSQFGGGITNDSESNPVEPGSGGGGTSGGAGGAGGGAVRISVGNNMTVNGLITANGAATTNGGGAGGTINLTALDLQGAGTMQASGGQGGTIATGGGGGGGGRIALIPASCSATYALSSNGGNISEAGAQPGRDGTWYPYPPSFTGTMHGTSSITWTWNSLCTADRYNVMTASNNVILSTPTVLTWDEVNLATNTAYGRQVRGRNAGTLFPSVLSPSVTFYTLAAIPGVPAEPFTGVYATSVTVNWLDNGNPSYTEYQVQASTAPDFTGTLYGPYVGDNGWGLGVSTTVIALSGCTTYNFRVQARNINNVETGYVVLGSTLTAGYYDCGARYFDGTQVVIAACMSATCPGGRLTINKLGANHFIGLVDPADPSASRMMIQTPEGVKAIRKYP